MGFRMGACQSFKTKGNPNEEMKKASERFLKELQPVPLYCGFFGVDWRCLRFRGKETRMVYSTTSARTSWKTGWPRTQMVKETTMATLIELFLLAIHSLVGQNPKWHSLDPRKRKSNSIEPIKEGMVEGPIEERGSWEIRKGFKETRGLRNNLGGVKRSQKWVYECPAPFTDSRCNLAHRQSFQNQRLQKRIGPIQPKLVHSSLVESRVGDIHFNLTC